jgi:hypothetical protein
MSIVRGYMGIADCAGQLVRCNDFNLNIKQEALFYDHTIGLRDSIPSSIRGGKSDQGNRNDQKVLYRPGTKIIQGGFSFPWTENSAGVLFNEVKTGDTFDMSFTYACQDLTRSFKSCKVNSYTIRASQGDIVTGSIDVMAISMTSSESSGNYTETEKIITWDNVDVTVGDFSGKMASFEITINNNCMPIYTSGQNAIDLSAKEIRIGMQTLTGNATFFEGDDLTYVEDALETTASFTTDGFSAVFDILLMPMTQQASTSAVLRTFQMVGIKKNVQ